MKKIISSTALFIIIVSVGLVYGSNSALYEVVDVYTCSRGPVLAELQAKIAVSRKLVDTVSFCRCDGIDPSFKTEVKDETCNDEKLQKLEQSVYICSCIGKQLYLKK